MTDEPAELRQNLDACEQALRELCHRSGISLVATRSDGKSLLSTLKGATQDWQLQVDCVTHSNYSLPRVDLVNASIPLAHVAPYGNVCFNDNQGLSIDKNRHPELVAHAVLEAYRLLERSIEDLKSGNHEFYNELEGYWGGFNGPECWSFMEVSTASKYVDVYVPHKNGALHPILISDKTAKLPPAIDVSKSNRVRGLYLALDDYIPVPPPGTTPDAQYVTNLLAGLVGMSKALWLSYQGSLSTRRPHLVYLFFSVPRQAGGMSVVGLRFTLNNRQVDSSPPVGLLRVFRHTAAYMRERGGANSALAQKHVAVLGCGSVGSEVADALASSGVGRLTLVDPEAFSIDNIFRHALGREWVGEMKVRALRSELTRKYPGIEVIGDVDTASGWLRNASTKEIDAIVVAIGQPTVERELHGDILTKKLFVPVVFAWLDPLDLGGHAVLIRVGKKGCLDCLYRDDEGSPALESRVTFLAPNQKVTKTLTGCASFYVPYGAVQSRRTALLATEQVIDGVLNGAGPAYGFWRGPGALAVANGLKPSVWWERVKVVAPESPTDLPFREGCRTCRGYE